MYEIDHEIDQSLKYIYIIHLFGLTWLIYMTVQQDEGKKKEL